MVRVVADRFSSSSTATRWVSAPNGPGKRRRCAAGGVAGGGHHRHERLAELGEHRRSSAVVRPGSKSSSSASYGCAWPRSRPRMRGAARRGARARRACAEVGGGERLHPRLQALGLGAREPGREVGGHADGLLEVAPRPVDDPCGVGVGGPPRPPTARARRAGGRARVGLARVDRALQRVGHVGAGAAPPGGIIVFWSQNISTPSACRSVISARRSRSRSARAVRHRPAFA